jgi:hypothetical protein
MTAYDASERTAGGIVLATTGAVANAWVLLVEILR